MKRYTIAVDFDGVLHSYTSPWVNAHTIPDLPVYGAMGWLTQIMRDFDIVIFTTRGKTWRGRRAVKRWLNQWRPEGDGWTFRVTATKPAALVYLDDRAMRFDGPGTFPSASAIHAARPWHKPSPPAATREEKT
jgi:hypothetical protein